MIRTLLTLLLLSLGNTVWIASLKAQGSDSPICLTTKQIDYLILQESDAHFLRIDTTIKGDKIKDLNRVINNQAGVITGGESIMKLRDKEINNYKVSFTDLSKKFTKQSKKLSLFRNGTVIFICTTIILGGVLLLK